MYGILCVDDSDKVEMQNSNQVKNTRIEVLTQPKRIITKHKKAYDYILNILIQLSWHIYFKLPYTYRIPIIIIVCNS